MVSAQPRVLQRAREVPKRLPSSRGESGGANKVPKGTLSKRDLIRTPVPKCKALSQRQAHLLHTNCSETSPALQDPFLCAPTPGGSRCFYPLGSDPKDNRDQTRGCRRAESTVPIPQTLPGPQVCRPPSEDGSKQQHERAPTPSARCLLFLSMQAGSREGSNKKYKKREKIKNKKRGDLGQKEKGMEQSLRLQET